MKKPQRSGPALDRRKVLGGLTALAGLSFIESGAFAGHRLRLGANPFVPRRDGEEPPSTLVVLVLDGGNDGLCTVVPHADDIYHRSRNKTRIRAEDVLKIDDYRGWHPYLAGIDALYKDGLVALVEGVGYPSPNRSHFSSMDIWQASRPEGRLAGEGWVGRLLTSLYGDDAAPNRAINVGQRLPYMMRSAVHPAVCFETPAGYRWASQQEELSMLADGTGDAMDPSLVAQMRTTMRSARTSSQEVLDAVGRYETPLEYPASMFGSGLRTIAALINGGIGCCVLSTKQIGFDTHVGQRDMHDGLMRELDAGLTPLVRDLQRTEAGRRTTVMVFSEFGRRVEENASAGTDHGVAGPMLVLGAPVAGGLYGKYPSLEPDQLDEGDLVHNVDFRSVYSSVIRGHFGQDPAPIVGGEFPILPILKG